MNIKEYLVEYLKEVANERQINLPEAERKDIVETMFAEQHSAFDYRLNAFLEVVEERFDDIQDAKNQAANEMTDEQDQAAEDFFNAGDFIEPNAVNHSGSNFEYVWEDFKAADAFHAANPDLVIYTVIETDDRFNIVNGRRIVDRYGYLFSKVDAGLPEYDEVRIR